MNITHNHKAMMMQLLFIWKSWPKRIKSWFTRFQFTIVRFERILHLFAQCNFLHETFSFHRFRLISTSTMHVQPSQLSTRNTELNSIRLHRDETAKSSFVQCLAFKLFSIFSFLLCSPSFATQSLNHRNKNKSINWGMREKISQLVNIRVFGGSHFKFRRWRSSLIWTGENWKK